MLRVHLRGQQWHPIALETLQLVQSPLVRQKRSLQQVLNKLFCHRNTSVLLPEDIVFGRYQKERRATTPHIFLYEGGIHKTPGKVN